MAINFCTIGRDTVDGFCGTQRAKVLATLIHEAGHDIVVVPPKAPIGHSGGSTFGRPQASMQYRQPLPIEKPTIPTELPFITVSAEVFGMSGSETLEVTTRLDFVVVTDLEMNVSEIAVNISDMEI